jgi:hypothetical protein
MNSMLEEYTNKNMLDWVQWFKPIILAPREVEIGGS